MELRADHKDKIPGTMRYFLNNRDLKSLLGNFYTSDLRIWFYSYLGEEGVRPLTEILKSNVEYPIVSLWWSHMFSHYSILIYPIKWEWRDVALKIFWKEFADQLVQWFNTPRPETWYLFERHLKLLYTTGFEKLRLVEYKNRTKV